MTFQQGATAFDKLVSERWVPHSYQKKAAKWLVEHPAAALFLDPGLGKTSITLAAFKALRRAKQAERMLVIAPLRVCYSVWPGECRRWKEFNDFKVVVLHGKDKEAALQEDADIFVINPEGLNWLLVPKRFNKLKVDTLVVDELTKFKHPRTARFKKLKGFLNKFRRRWGLTGTPAANGLLDLFGQMYVIDGGYSLGKYITHYRMKYFRAIDPNGWKWVPQEGADEKIYERLSKLALSMSAEDYLELPELMHGNIVVELPPNAQRIYEELEDELITKIEENLVVAQNAAAAAVKCRQVANGGIYLDATEETPATSGVREWEHLHDAKTEALVELVDELQGQPLLVAYEFQHDAQRIVEALGEDVPVIGGGVSAKESQRIVDEWNAGEHRVLVGHPQSIGHGLNLQSGGARHICWYGLTWDFELYDQFIRRIWRQGSRADRVFVYHIIAEGTVDHLVLRALGSKNRKQKALFDALKSLRRK